MAELTLEQFNFLKSQRISLSSLFDASGLSQDERKQQMKLLDKLFYFGGAKCKAGGHSLRTRSGHCIECDTSKIAFQQRHSASGYVYLAYSKSHQLVKVGYSSEHPQDRNEFLRKEGYGNIRDWDVKQIASRTSDAGKLEFDIHGELEGYRYRIVYEKRGQLVECREIFRCSLEHALAVFKKQAAI